MGNFFSTQKHQTQYKVCDVCKSNIILYEWCFIPSMSNYLDRGEIYFKCNNGHRFFIHTIGQSYEMIFKRFNCPKV